MFYSKDQIEKARDSNLLLYLHQNGYKLLKSGRDEYRLEEHDSLVISNNKWNWFSRSIGGNTLDFLVKYEGKDFMEAVGILTGDKIPEGREARNAAVKPYCSGKSEARFVVPVLELPEKNNNYRRLFAYLIKTRCLDKDIITALVKECLIYESKDTHNVVFLGKDKEGNIKHAAMRGTLSNKSYKNDCSGSDKRYCFNMKGKSDTLFVFEAAIDLLSHATITKIEKGDYREDHRMIVGGISALSLYRYLEDNPGIKNISLCLDNDKAGRAAAQRIAEDLADTGKYNISEEFPPSGKDWNEYLRKHFFRVKNNVEKDII